MSFNRKDVRSSSWLRSRYFYPSSQIHTRVCELCLWASTADRGQHPAADWSPQQNIRGCLYLTVDNLAGSDITRTRRLEEKGSNQTSTLLSSTIPNYITMMAVRSFPQASIKLPAGNFSRLSDHHHHHQVSSAPDQLYFVHPLQFAHTDGFIYIHTTCRCNIPLPGYMRREDYNYNSS